MASTQSVFRFSPYRGSRAAIVFSPCRVGWGEALPDPNLYPPQPERLDPCPPRGVRGAEAATAADPFSLRRLRRDATLSPGKPRGVRSRGIGPGRTRTCNQGIMPTTTAFAAKRALVCGLDCAFTFE